MNERIGDCERCGALDHHLVDGLCPSCAPLAKTIDATAEGEHQANDDYAISEAVGRAKRASLEWSL